MGGSVGGSCMVMALVLGPAFLIGALVCSIKAAQDQRSNQVGDYNTAVEAWQAGGYQEWQALHAGSSTLPLRVAGLWAGRNASVLQPASSNTPGCKYTPTDGVVGCDYTQPVPGLFDSYTRDLLDYSVRLASSEPPASRFAVS